MDIEEDMCILQGQFLVDVNDYKRPFEVKLFSSGVQYYPLPQSRSSTVSRDSSRDEDTTGDAQCSVNGRRSSKRGDVESDVTTKGTKKESQLQIETSESVSSQFSKLNSRPAESVTTNGISERLDPISPDVFHDSAVISPLSGHLNNEKQTSQRRASVTGRSVNFLHISSILGCDCQKGKDSSDTAAYFVIYAYPAPSKERKPSEEKVHTAVSRKRETLTVKFGGGDATIYEQNFKRAACWMVVLTNILGGKKININTGNKQTLVLKPF